MKNVRNFLKKLSEVKWNCYNTVIPNTNKRSPIVALLETLSKFPE